MSDATRCCAIEGCDRKHFAADLCGSHYKRRWRYGNPDGGPRPQLNRPLMERLRDRFDESPTGCWLWRAGFDSMGYGNLIIDRRTWRAHRAMWVASGRELLDGFELDHLCCVKRCVNPDHLEQVTHSENMLRHYARQRA